MLFNALIIKHIIIIVFDAYEQFSVTAKLPPLEGGGAPTLPCLRIIQRHIIL